METDWADLTDEQIDAMDDAELRQLAQRHGYAMMTEEHALGLVRTTVYKAIATGEITDPGHAEKSAALAMRDALRVNAWRGLPLC